MISIKACPEPDRGFNVWEIQLVDPTNACYHECMHLQVTFNDDFQPCFFDAYVDMYDGGFWQRASALCPADYFNPEAFDDTWRIGCRNDYLREDNWSALKNMVHLFLQNLVKQIRENPLLYPWLKCVTSPNGQELNLHLHHQPWSPPRADLNELLLANQVAESDLADATLDPTTGLSHKLVQTRDRQMVDVEFWDLSRDD